MIRFSHRQYSTFCDYFMRLEANILKFQYHFIENAINLCYCFLVSTTTNYISNTLSHQGWATYFIVIVICDYILCQVLDLLHCDIASVLSLVLKASLQ